MPRKDGYRDDKGRFGVPPTQEEQAKIDSLGTEWIISRVKKGSLAHRRAIEDMIIGGKPQEAKHE